MMQTMEKKKMTIEKLAQMTQRGFVDVEERLGGRIDNLGTRMEQGFDELSRSLHQLTKAVESGFQHVNARLDALREDISDLPEIRQGLRDLEARVGRLERKVGTAK